MVLLMKTNTSPVLPGEVQEYVHLQRQIHDALRKEHPEWVEPNGESPMCDFYEARLTEQLETFTRRGSNARKEDFPSQ
jgi:23S rRNA maturation mini-RNase III